MIPITDDSDILSDISIKILNQFFVHSLGKRLTRGSTPSPPRSLRSDSLDLVDDEQKEVHMRETLGLVRSESHTIAELDEPIVLLDTLDINLLSKNDKVKLEKGLRQARKNFTEAHGHFDLTSDLVWRYLKQTLPVMLVRPEELQASLARQERYCGTNIPYSQLANHRSTLKTAHNRKEGHENDILISRASLKKFNLSAKDAKPLVKQAQACYIKIDSPVDRSSM